MRLSDFAAATKEKESSLVLTILHKVQL